MPQDPRPCNPGEIVILQRLPYALAAKVWEAFDYAFEDPPPNAPFSVARFAALGYVFCCVVGLIVMGVAMALRVCGGQLSIDN